MARRYGYRRHEFIHDPRKPIRNASCDQYASVSRNETIVRFPSVADMTRHMGPVGNQRDRAESPIGWFNDETPALVYQYGQRGNDSLVPKAEQLMGQLEYAFEIPERTVLADMAGAYPCVPAFIGNDPLCMRRRSDEESDRSPVSIYVNLTSSCATASETLMKRGLAVLALVMALQQERPVSLHVFVCVKGSESRKEAVIVAEIPTAPLDLATACYAMTSSALARDTMYGIAQRDVTGWGGLSWPVGYSYIPPSDGTADKYHVGLLQRLGGTGKDLIIPGTHLDDKAVKEPVKWINDRLEHFRATIDD